MTMGWLRNYIRRLLGIGQYGTPATTKAGERVKSVSEARIADYLYQQRITYIYEPRLRISLLSLKAMHPDFYLPDYDVYVEFWGLQGVGNYDSVRKLKLKAYKRRRKRLLQLYPKDIYDLQTVFPYKLEQIMKKN